MAVQIGRWRKTIHLKDLLDSDGSPANVRRVAGEITKRLKAQREYDPFCFDDFSVLVEEFNEIAKSTPDDYDEGLSILEHFNSCMAQLYDWADVERVWIA